MNTPNGRSFVSLDEVVRRVAVSNFPGDREDIDRKEALDDILNALKDGVLYAQGIIWEISVTEGVRTIHKSDVPKHITPAQWRDFQYSVDENVLNYEISGVATPTYKTVTIKAIKADCAAVDRLWPKRGNT